MNIGPHQLPNPWILAPMAGVSEMPFRVIARRMGAGAAPTELVSAKGLVYGQERTARYVRHDPSEQPFWVQIFGGDVESMAEGAVRARELGAAIIDINMGCPVKKVTKNGAGSALMRDPQRAAAIVEAIGNASGLPVTAKIRSGWDADTLNNIELTKRLADAGCAAIAMHARTKAQGYSGTADWSLIRELVAASPIPVIGNGDVFTADDARRMRQETGCAAVMIGRGALGNPWIFAQLERGDSTRPTPTERWQVVQEHFYAHRDAVGDDLRAVRKFRQHLMWYSHGLRYSTAFRRKITRVDAGTDVLAESEAFFTAAELAKDAKGHAEIDTRTALG